MQEKRTAPRVQTDLGFISCSSGISTGSRITNISATGAFIQTEQPLPIDAELDLHLQLPDDAEIMSIDARVVWNKFFCRAAAAGMGIRFTNILPKHHQKLNVFIEKKIQSDNGNTQGTLYV